MKKEKKISRAMEILVCNLRARCLFNGTILFGDKIITVKEDIGYIHYHQECYQRYKAKTRKQKSVDIFNRSKRLPGSFESGKRR